MSKEDDPEEETRPSKAQIKQLAQRLGVLQRDAKSLGIPTLIVIEGLDASSKGHLLNQILMEFDSRAFKVYSTHASHQEPRAYPLLHRFWINTPVKGKVQFYDRSYYYLALDAWAEGKLHEDELDGYWEDIRRFERQLTDGGVQMMKFFLILPKKEQAKRFRKLESNPKTAWRVTPKDWRRHRQFRSYLETVDSMVEKTDAPYARWRVVDTKNYRAALVQVYEQIIELLENAIASRSQEAPASASTGWIHYKGQNYLDRVKHPPPMDRDAYRKELKRLQGSIHDLVHEVHFRQIPVALVYCGWDAAGKGGCIKRLVQSIDPRGYEVVPIAAPTQVELSHHYLWRFWREMPHKGKITVFDRSWYGRVLVERVESLCSNDEWQRAYREINEMESHLSDFGAVIVKFWLHIDKQTQLERFKAREADPFKQWKITEEDWRNRKKWDRYEEAVNQMIDETDTPRAPWTIVSANCKMRARIKTLTVIADALAKAVKSHNLKPL